MEEKYGTCRIFGTATASSPETECTITAENKKGSSSVSFKIRIIDSSSAPDFQALDRTARFAYKSDITKLSLTNNGGKPTSCEVEPALPVGMYVAPFFDSCEIIAVFPGKKISETTYY